MCNRFIFCLTRTNVCSIIELATLVARKMEDVRMETNKEEIVKQIHKLLDNASERELYLLWRLLLRMI